MTGHPSAYRKTIAQVAAVLLAAFFVVRDGVNGGTSLGNWGLWAQVLVALAGAFLVYMPESPWAKLAAGLGAALGQILVASLSDNTITGTEATMIVGQVLSFAATGLIDNRPAEPVRPAETTGTAETVGRLP